MFRSAITATTILLAMATGAMAQVELKQKILENGKTTASTRSKVHQVLSIADQEVETKTDQTIVVTSVSGKRAADGTIRLTTKVDSLKANLNLPGGVELEFDSAKPVEPQGTQYDILLNLMQVVAKTSSTSVHGKDNRVVSIEVDTSEHEKLDDMLKKMIKGRFEPEYLKEASNKKMDQIPSQPVKKGDTWEIEQTVRLEAGQTMTFKTTYKYAGTIDRKGKTLHKITFISTEVEYAQDDPDAQAKVINSNLKIKASDGTILFDQKLGRVVEQEEMVHIIGDMTFSINDQELPAKLDLKFDTKTAVK